MLALLFVTSVLLENELPKKDTVIYKFPQGRRYYWTNAVIDAYKRPKFGKKVTIYFDFDSAVLRKDQIPKLNIFKRGDRVEVRGYASPEGTKEYNLRLSEKRARNVKNYLKKRGVVVKKLKAFGEDFCFEEKKNWWKCRKVEVEER